MAADDLSDVRLLARVASACPYPVVLVDVDGTLVWAGQHAAPLLQLLEAQVGDLLAPTWSARIALVAASGNPTRAVVDSAGGGWLLDLVPTPDHAATVVYGTPAAPHRAVAAHPDAVVLITDGRVATANAAAAALLEVLGAAVGETVDEPFRAAAERAREEGQATLSTLGGGQQLLVRFTRLSARTALVTATQSAPGAADGLGAHVLANMSHELRTPLNAIVGYAELLADELRDLGEDQLTADLGRIVDAASALRRLIQDLLELARLEAGRSELVIDRFAVADLVRGVAESARARVESRGNELVVQLDEPGTASGDVEKLRKVLDALLDNAARFTRDGTVTLAARSEGEGVAIEVRDTGVGLSVEDLERLTGLFSQADASATRAHEGVGLGLALVRVLLRRLGGRLSVTGAPGRGATFRCWIPRSGISPRAESPE